MNSTYDNERLLRNATDGIEPVLRDPSPGTEDAIANGAHQ